MEPQVRYAHASDGVGIAYWRLGEGPPLVQTPMIPFSHIEAEWQHPEMRRWYERLARGASVIRYDGRGNGLSQRDVADYSLAAHVRDLEAVVEDLGPDPVTLLGVFHSGPAAIAYAALHPGRVSHLVLWCTYARGEDYWRAAQAEGLRVLRQTDYGLFLRTAAHELLGWAEDDQAQRFAEVMRLAVDPDEADRLIAATRGFDVAADLPGIESPTLVVHRRELQWLDVALSRDLASRIGGARLSVIDGSSPLPGAGTVDEAARPIEDFLEYGERQEVSSVPGDVFRAILFTDLVGHTEMISRLGDEQGREVLRRHEEITRDALRAHDGTEVKALGDGFLASFASVTSALECAVAIQRRIEKWNESEGPGGSSHLRVRIGLNAGEPIEEDGDLFGATVNLASRIADRAHGGQILVANAVRELGLGKQFSFQDRGQFRPKGFDESVKVWEVLWRE